jgi:Domain of unknown function (DUF4189)
MQLVLTASFKKDAKGDQMKISWRNIRNITVLVAGLALSPAAFAGYGAIAFNTTTYAVGEAHGYYTLDDAESAALNACGGGCQIMNWEQNKCNAFATDSAAHAWGRATGMGDANSAVNAAISACGTANCVSRIWICG